MDVRDVRMIQRREHLGFALKASQPVRIGGKQIRQKLQRDITPELRVARAIDLTHSARAER
jgi:hypothetical protein